MILLPHYLLLSTRAIIAVGYAQRIRKTISESNRMESIEHIQQSLNLDMLGNYCRGNFY
jgi:hypothetical protein